MKLWGVGGRSGLITCAVVPIQAGRGEHVGRGEGAGRQVGAGEVMEEGRAALGQPGV